MTKAEFHALGITERDLVCIEIDNIKRIGKLHSHGDHFWEICLGMKKGKYFSAGNYEMIDAVEIIKKDFWHD